MINNIQPPIVICCSLRVHTFTGQDTMVPSVALWHRFARFSNGVGFTQLALFGGGMYFKLLVYIPEASTLGFSEVEGSLLVLPYTRAFSLVFSEDQYVSEYSPLTVHHTVFADSRFLP
ncbi:hypothetical protein Tco_0811630 [Tanacetum coccineum]